MLHSLLDLQEYWIHKVLCRFWCLSLHTFITIDVIFNSTLHYVLFERLALYTNMSMWHYCGTLLKSTLLNKDWNACSDILAKWSPGYMQRLLLKNHVPQRPSHVCLIGLKNVLRKNLPHPNRTLCKLNHWNFARMPDIPNNFWTLYRERSLC